MIVPKFSRGRAEIEKRRAMAAWLLAASHFSDAALARAADALVAAEKDHRRRQRREAAALRRQIAFDKRRTRAAIRSHRAADREVVQ